VRPSIPVKYFDWDDAKNAKLRAERGIGFEEIVFHIERGDVLDILPEDDHPEPESHQEYLGEESDDEA
jgi:uncharacterized DUF497 family protein